MEWIRRGGRWCGRGPRPGRSRPDQRHLSARDALAVERRDEGEIAQRILDDAQILPRDSLTQASGEGAQALLELTRAEPDHPEPLDQLGDGERPEHGVVLSRGKCAWILGVQRVRDGALRLSLDIESIDVDVRAHPVARCTAGPRALEGPDLERRQGARERTHQSAQWWPRLRLASWCRARRWRRGPPAPPAASTGARASTRISALAWAVDSAKRSICSGAGSLRSVKPGKLSLSGTSGAMRAASRMAATSAASSREFAPTSATRVPRATRTTANGSSMCMCWPRSPTAKRAKATVRHAGVHLRVLFARALERRNERG